MEELHRSLAINMSRDDYAAKGLKFAIAYVKRERGRQKLVMSIDTDENVSDKKELMSDMLDWKEGLYGKAWAANVRERPRPQQLLAVSAMLPLDDDNDVFMRFAPCHFI